jgi:hypothetical protein
MRCILPDKGCIILQDIHSGIGGSQAGACMLVGKTYRQGFYWPIAVCDTDSLVCRCEGCQFVARQKHVISSTPDHTDHLTFLYMGVDLVGPFKKGKRWIHTQLHGSR